jgi:hypothetical protein
MTAKASTPFNYANPMKNLLLIVTVALLLSCETPVMNLQKRAEAKWGPQNGWSERQKHGYLAGMQVLMGGEQGADQTYAAQIASVNAMPSSYSYPVYTPYGVYNHTDYGAAGIAQGGAALAAGITRATQTVRNEQAAEQVMLMVGGN